MLVSSRTTNLLLVLLLAVGIGIVAMLASGVRGGPLDPPGPVASTGKSVIYTIPYSINTSGSYVLDGNVSCAACGGFANGISVNADNVTIDLQGFDLVGGPSAGYGIYAPGRKNVTIEHGSIRNWPNGSVWTRDSGSATTIDEITSTGGSGGLKLGDDSIVRNCRAENGTFDQGIIVGDRSSVTNCVVANNGSQGIVAGQDATITDVIVRGNGNDEIQTGDGATIEHCTVDGAASAGSGVNVGARSVVRGCTVRDNNAREISAGEGSVLENCVADGMGTPDSGIVVGVNSVVRGCTARANGDAEIYAYDGSLVEDCVADGELPSPGGRSSGSGIVIYTGSIVRNCNIANNNDHGIYVFGPYARLEGNRIYNSGLDDVHITNGQGTACLMNQWGFNELVMENGVGSDCNVALTPSGTNGPWMNWGN